MHWEQLESLLDRQTKDPDKLNELFVKVSSDLSYARTFYPNRSVRLYLNNLTQRVFDSMRTDEDKFKFSQITNFFQHVLPQEIYNSRKALITSFLVFVLAFAIGIISSKFNPDFPRLILGDEYVEMTEENIANGDPMAVYKDERKVDMFFGITTNNIKVSILAFVLGIIGSIGTIFVLLSNGIMVGAFQYFFIAKGLFWTSFLTIWIHGTIEISAIIIAGAAGIVLGNGLLFPKTHTRSQALQVGALRALRIILGTVPLFVIAGFLESFVTRQTELPTVVKASIIILSALFILLMWVIYPWYYHKMNLANDLTYNLTPNHKEVRVSKKYSQKDFTKIIADSFQEFRIFLGKNLSHILVPTTLILGFATFVQLHLSGLSNLSFENAEQFNISKLGSGSILFSVFSLLLISYVACMIAFILNKDNHTFISKLKFLKANYIQVVIITALIFIPYTLIDSAWWALILIFFSPHFYVIMIENITSSEDSIFQNFKKSFNTSLNNWLKFIPIYFIIYLMFYVIQLVQNTFLNVYVIDFLSWHKLFADESHNQIFVSTLVTWTLIILSSPVIYYFLKNLHYSLLTEQKSIDLKEKLKLFGNSNSVFETR